MKELLQLLDKTAIVHKSGSLWTGHGPVDWADDGRIATALFRGYAMMTVNNGAPVVGITHAGREWLKQQQTTELTADELAGLRWCETVPGMTRRLDIFAHLDSLKLIDAQGDVTDAGRRYLAEHAEPRTWAELQAEGFERFISAGKFEVRRLGTGWLHRDGRFADYAAWTDLTRDADIAARRACERWLRERKGAGV